MTNGMKKSISQSVPVPSILSIYIYDTDLCDQHLNDQWNEEVSRSVSQSVPVPSILSIYI